METVIFSRLEIMVKFEYLETKEGMCIFSVPVIYLSIGGEHVNVFEHVFLYHDKDKRDK